MTRRLAGPAVAVLLVLASCDREPPLAPEPPEVQPPLLLSVSDGTRGGNPGFFFLPPLGPDPENTGTFDGSHAPVVDLCEWGTVACAAHPLLSENARVDTEGEAYKAELKLKTAGLEEGRVYRIRVLVAGNVLGWMDVSPKQGPAGTLQLAKNGVTAGADDVVEVNANQTLVVRFRIDEGAIALPTAAFSVGGSLDAKSPTAFDASASSSPGGGRLTYGWVFGDGTRGGGERVAHIYATGGDFEVTLVVTTEDGTRASASRRVSISAPPPPAGAATVHGVVEATDGSPLGGVSVRVVDGTTSATTDASGAVTLSGVPTGVPVTLRLSRSGFADQFVALDIPASSTTSRFEATMRPRQPAVQVASIEAGAEVAGGDGARLQLPPMALVDAEGLVVTGTVDVSLTSVDVTEPDAGAFPGGYSAVEVDGSSAELLSYGVAEFVISQDGKELDLAPGQTAIVEIPVSVAGVVVGEELPLWSLDETMGVWVREGNGVVVASATSPTGLALRAEVGHFSWWNIDVAMEPHHVQVQCLDGGVPVSCTVKGTFQEPGQPVRSATETVPAEGASLPIPSGVDVTLEAQGALGTIFDQQVVNGSAGGTTNLTFDLTAAFSPTLRCEDAAGTSIACTVRDTGGDVSVYENLPAGGKEVLLEPDVPITLRGFEAGGLTGEITLQGAPGETGTFTITLTDVFLVDVACLDRLGAPSACSVNWFVPGQGAQALSVGTSGATISLPADEPITLQAKGPWAVFTGVAAVQGAAGTSQSVTIDLVGQGGSFCGDASGAPLSLEVVTVSPTASCAPGVVKSPQEAILFVAHGGTIRFDAGTHRAVRLDVPRDDLTMEPVLGTTAVIVAGTGDPDGYDGTGFKFLGSGSIVVRGLTFRSPGTGRGGIGFLTGPNNINGAGAFTSFLVDDVDFEGLRIGLGVTPSSAPGAAIMVQASRFGGSAVVGGRGILIITNANGATPTEVVGNTFVGDPAKPFSALFAADFGASSALPWTVTDNVFEQYSGGVGTTGGRGVDPRSRGGELADGSVFARNDFRSPTSQAVALQLTAAPSATVAVTDNTITGSFNGGDPADPANYSLDRGVRLAGGTGSTFDLRRNAISGAATAIEHQGAGALAATDQVIDQVHTPITSEAAENVTMRDSDVTNFSGAPYVSAGPLPFGDGALQCIWWGDAAGPHGAGSGDPVVTPWAIAPIANGAGGACTGG